MSGPDRRSVEMLQEEFERQRSQVGEMQQRLRELSATVVSPRREVSVTVGSQGVLQDLHFPTSTYRKLPKNELAELITDTIAAAREKALDQTAAVIAPSLPEGLDPKAMLKGDIDVASMPQPELPPMVAEMQKRRAALLEEHGR
ncbi:YbaB/EbfC family nucleoid-associated protein [Saccharopolyspora sp. NFXS83]|uniref:YbaB/EbfC family nucleoid-associated protein n=1 Tax=Saccharopolyspora sp. NFXS83 TaxID=2993560 RepID=UPI00224AF79B|nr:YbaB/EbfC family nucleoid-associated protein [Saccharopolyspora sp. NFXS83]MCX2731757.1 YbaB/EbfC family nucleoid-associated protein [Saccharopolyspora sp. NFXS83]